jgi:hypothetical protein
MLWRALAEIAGSTVRACPENLPDKLSETSKPKAGAENDVRRPQVPDLGPRFVFGLRTPFAEPTSGAYACTRQTVRSEPDAKS